MRAFAFALGGGLALGSLSSRYLRIFLITSPSSIKAMICILPRYFIQDNAGLLKQKSLNVILLYLLLWASKQQPDFGFHRESEEIPAILSCRTEAFPSLEKSLSIERLGSVTETTRPYSDGEDRVKSVVTHDYLSS